MTAARKRALAKLGAMSDRQLEALPTNTLDRAAFGFTTGDKITVPIDSVVIVHKGDFENALHELRHSPTRWNPYIDEPVDFSFRGGKLRLEDGHHRYLLRRARGKKTITGTVEHIEDNPILAIRRATAPATNGRSAGHAARRERALAWAKEVGAPPTSMLAATRGRSAGSSSVVLAPASAFFAWKPKLEKTRDEIRRGELSYSKYEPVRVSRLDSVRGGLFVMDGHHRIIERILDGEKKIPIILDKDLPRVERTGGAHANVLADKMRVVDFVAGARGGIR